MNKQMRPCFNHSFKGTNFQPSKGQTFQMFVGYFQTRSLLLHRMILIQCHAILLHYWTQQMTLARFWTPKIECRSRQKPCSTIGVHFSGKLHILVSALAVLHYQRWKAAKNQVEPMSLLKLIHLMLRRDENISASSACPKTSSLNTTRIQNRDDSLPDKIKEVIPFPRFIFSWE